MTATRLRHRVGDRSLAGVLIACLWVAPVVFFAYFTLFARWQEAEAALRPLGPGPRIVVGVSVQGSASGPTKTAHRSQVYLALPESLRTLNAYVVAQDGDRLHVETIRFGLFVFAGFYLAWIGASLWYLLRRDGGSS